MVFNNEWETLANVATPALYLLEAKLATTRLRLLTPQHIRIVILVDIIVVVKEFFDCERVFPVWVEQKQQIF